MRPFRFFFVLSMSVVLFFFVARFVIIALVLAAVLSGLLFLIQRARHFFSGLVWNQYYPETRYEHHAYPRLLQEASPDDVPFHEFDRMELPNREWQIIKIG